jgi:hypothetical protein
MIVLMHFQWLNFISQLLTFLTVVTVFVGVFAICSKNEPQNKHCAILTLPDKKIPERWIIFDALMMTELCPLLQDRFGQ